MNYIFRTLSARVLFLVLTAGTGPLFGQGAAVPDERPSIADMLEDVTPAVVSVGVTSSSPIPQDDPALDDPFFRRFFDIPEGQSLPEQRPRSGMGSGVIIDAAEGYVLTNHHVIEGAEQVEVTLADRRTFPAEVIGSDPGTDIGLLRIDAQNLIALRLSDSDHLRVGDFVVAIGNPFGIGQTVTSGIVSALSRGAGIIAEGYEDFIQTDASINPGNSGGALVDYNGNLIGINSAIIAPAGGNVGIGFAVPINMAQAVAEQLIEYGEVTRGQIGVVIQDLTPDAADLLGVETDLGAVVTQVQSDSQAEVAGVRAGDIITEVDGELITSSRDLRNTIGLLRPGDTVTLTVIREDERTSLDVVIGGSEALAEAIQTAGGEGLLEGAALRDMDGDVVVGDVAQGSRAWNNGLRVGDVIVEVNRETASASDDVREALRRSDEGAAALLIRRENQELFLIVR